MSRRTRYPALPAARTLDVAVRQALDGLREQAMRWRGDIGPVEDRVVTFGDLQDSGIGQINRRGGNDGALAPPDPTVRRVGPLSNLNASGAFEVVILEWDGTNQRYYAYTEVWRATVDDFGQAVLRGKPRANVFRDSADQDQTYYYWVRPVSTSDHVGPINASDGTKAETSLSPDDVRDVLTQTEWQANAAYRPFRVVQPTGGGFSIDGVPVGFQATVGGTSGSSEPDWQNEVSQLGDTVTDGTVTWQAIDAAKTPLIIGYRNGNPVVVIPGAFINDASIQTAKIKEATITTALIADAAIVSAKIGNAEITTAKIDAAAITTAKIQDLAVDTLKLKDQAVTIQAAAYTQGSKTVAFDSWTEIQTQWFGATGTAPVVIEACMEGILDAKNVSDGESTQMRLRLLRDGNQIYGTAIAVSAKPNEIMADTAAIVITDSPAAGSRNYKLQAIVVNDGGTDIAQQRTANVRSLVVSEAKK